MKFISLNKLTLKSSSDFTLTKKRYPKRAPKDQNDPKKQKKAENKQILKNQCYQPQERCQIDLKMK